MSHATTDRRRFLQQSASAALGVAAGSMAWPLSARAQGANDRIVVGMMGMGGRGGFLADLLAARADATVAWVCDPDASRISENVLKALEQRGGTRPRATQDFREILDDQAVDALVIATPDHWHALGTILACQAGKDVYVEKPASHSIWEGRQMVEAARKYRRVVQLGTQNRSAQYAQAAVEYVRSGQLGDVHYVRVLNMKWRDAIGHKDDTPVPEGLDYDLWLGPAPMRPYNPNRSHYAWHWYWDYSGGDIINDGVHQMDLARWMINRAHPNSVVASGGKYHFDDDQETPDTQVVLYDYDGLTMSFELTLWTPYMLKTDPGFRAQDIFPDWPFNATRIDVFGSKGMMIMGRHGEGWQVFGPDTKVVAQRHGPEAHSEHLTNFFECIRTRQRPTADIEEGHLSTILCHLGNISYRVGGRRLKWDGATEAFWGDDEANALLKRVYREPWVVQEEI